MTVGLHHAALTVTDMDRSITWYTELFGFVELAREPHFGGGGGNAVVLGPEDKAMYVVMNEHPTNAGEPFDPTRTGLDHIGFTVPDRSILDEWVATFEAKGVTYSPITEHDWGWSLNFRDPDEIALQLVVFKTS